MTVIRANNTNLMKAGLDEVLDALGIGRGQVEALDQVARDDARVCGALLFFGQAVDAANGGWIHGSSVVVR